MPFSASFLRASLKGAITWAKALEGPLEPSFKNLCRAPVSLSLESDTFFPIPRLNVGIMRIREVNLLTHLESFHLLCGFGHGMDHPR